MVMLAFGIFAGTFATTANPAVLTINAKVEEIIPTFILRASTDSSLTVGSTTVDLGSNTDDIATLDTGTHRFTKGVGGTVADDNSLVVYFGLVQNESRYASDITVSMEFSKLKYIGNGDTNDMPKGTTTDTLKDDYATELPVIDGISKRSSTIGLTVGDFTKNDANSNDEKITYTSTLDYSIFGYFIRKDTTLILFKATYNLPTYSDNRAYMPFGNYQGTVKVTYTSNT